MVDWQARWIWARSHVDTCNFYLYARREFQTEAVGPAGAAVSCSSEYRLYVNGRYVGRGPSPCHPAFQYYDEHDVTHLLRPGKNVIAAVCYNYGEDTHCRPRAPGGFLLQLQIGNGEPQVIATDQSWRVLPGFEWDTGSARMFWTTGFQEVYDSRRKPVGWNVVGFDDSDWQTPFVIGEVGVEPWVAMVPREIPHLREREVFAHSVLGYGEVDRGVVEPPDVATRMYAERLRPEPEVVECPGGILTPGGDAAIIRPGQDAFVALDFGREVVGFPTVRIRDGGTAVIDLGYSEALDENGRVHPTRQGILQADRLVTHGGRQEWQTFGRRAFRYLQLTFRDLSAPLQIECVSVNTVGYPVEQVSEFECSDALLNDIWRVGAYTLSLCMQDQYEDCPLREHGQYPGDLRVGSLTNYYCFFDTALVRKGLAQYVQNQREDGFFNALWPSGTNHALPDYNLVWVMALHDYYLHTGDADLVERLFPNLRLLLDGWIRTQEGIHGLLVYEADAGRMLQEWWLFIDHAPLDKRGEVAAYNAFYYQALRDASKLAAAVGCHEEARAWHSRADAVSRAFNERFWSDENGVYADCRVDDVLSDTVSTHANTLAVLFGLADAERSRRIREYLESEAPRVRTSGPYFDFYVLQMLAKTGAIAEALRLIRSNWGEMLRRGATTWWETFDPLWEDGKLCPDSLCHGWSAAPTYFLPAEVLGVKPSIPGSDVVVIQPGVGDLEWARGRIKTHSHLIEVEWQRRPGHFRLDVNAPGGFIAALPVEGFTDPVIEEIDLSPETPERRARRTYGWGNVIWRHGEQRDPYLDWLATQESEPPEHYRPARRLSAESGYVWIRESPITHVRYDVRESPAQ